MIAAADENIDALVAGAGAPAPAAGAPGTGDGRRRRQQETAGALVGAADGRAVAGRSVSTPPQEKVADVPPAAPAAPPRRACRARAPQPPRRSAPRPGDVRVLPARAPPRAASAGSIFSSVQGSGPGGRIIKRDIEAAAAAGQPRRRPPRPLRSRAARSGAIPREGDFHDVPLTQIRKTIARRLAESIGPIPTFYLTAEFDSSA